MPVYLPEIKGERAGLYVLSPNLNRDVFKIGISQSIKKRMNSYHICFPEGFYIHAIIIIQEKYKNTNIGKEKQGTIQKSVRYLFKIV